MGCICSKVSRATKYLQRSVRRKETTKPAKRLVSLSKKDEVVVELDGNANVSAASLISIQPGNDNAKSTPVSFDDGEKKEKIEQVSNHQRITSIMSISNGERGAQVVAGWPSWLTAVAGEAINGWVPRRADSFEKLDKLSLSGAWVFRRLSLYLIFEYMEHDLAGLLASPGIKFSEAQKVNKTKTSKMRMLRDFCPPLEKLAIKCYMQQLLHGLEHCHNRGILHRDIKGSNLLIDSNGNLKIADFGLATFFSSPQKQPLTSRVVTLWYRPPELLLGATEYGVSVDLWSTGCILAELFVGKHIMPGRTEDLISIICRWSNCIKSSNFVGHLLMSTGRDQNCRTQPFSNLNILINVVLLRHFKDFPSSALALLDVLLAVEPEARGTALSALDSEFFMTKPLPSDPSTLPKYPPTKEFDVKFQDENARRRRAAGGKGHGYESARRGSKESKAMPAPDANAELQASMQKQQGRSKQIGIGEIYSHEEDGVSRCPIESAAKGTARNTYSHSGQQTAQLRAQRSFVERGAAQLSRFSNSVAVRGDSQFHGGSSTNLNLHWPQESFNARYNNLDDSSHGLLGRPKFLNKKPGLESTMGYPTKKGHVHYSGPLVPQGGKHRGNAERARETNPAGCA
ncbi:hypothetical protein OIU76_004890 [Salix suchowensis]|nr:hypothetical protein OIU76_004890 [Salix suchowensis]